MRNTLSRTGWANHGGRRPGLEIVLASLALFVFLSPVACRPPIAAYAPAPRATDSCDSRESFTFFADQSLAAKLSADGDFSSGKIDTKEGRWASTPDGSMVVFTVDPVLWAREFEFWATHASHFSAYVNKHEGKLGLKIGEAGWGRSGPYIDWQSCYFYFEPEAKTADAASGLLVRAAPSTRSKHLALIPKGTLVESFGCIGPTETISGTTSPWCRVKFGETHGWAFGGFLR